MLVQDLDLDPLPAVVLGAVVPGAAPEGEPVPVQEHEQVQDPGLGPVGARTGWVPSTAGTENVD